MTNNVLVKFIKYLSIYEYWVFSVPAPCAAKYMYSKLLPTLYCHALNTYLFLDTTCCCKGARKPPWPRSSSTYVQYFEVMILAIHVYSSLHRDGASLTVHCFYNRGWISYFYLQMTHSITLLVLVHQNIYNSITVGVSCASTKVHSATRFSLWS